MNIALNARSLMLVARLLQRKSYECLGLRLVNGDAEVEVDKVMWVDCAELGPDCMMDLLALPGDPGLSCLLYEAACIYQRRRQILPAIHTSDSEQRRPSRTAMSSRKGSRWAQRLCAAMTWKEGG